MYITDTIVDFRVNLKKFQHGVKIIPICVLSNNTSRSHFHSVTRFLILRMRATNGWNVL